MNEPGAPVVLEFEANDGVATISFNRPSVFNALDVAMAEAFEDRVAQLSRLAGVRCVVLTGVGKAFMAGGDVAAFAGDLANADRTLSRILTHMHPALLTLRRIDAPLVAAVNGIAAGAGLSLVLAADYVVASANARLLLAYDKLGVPPDCGGSWFLARKLGRARAFELMLTGRVLSAQEAVDLGIVNILAEEKAFAGQVREEARKIAAGPTKAFGMFKKLLDTELPLAAHLELERELFMAATATEDFKSAVAAFVEKLPTTYQGR